MNFVINALVSWKTTILGIATVAVVLAKWASAGAIDFNDIPVILAGFTGLAAKDANVTGIR